MNRGYYKFLKSNTVDIIGCCVNHGQLQKGTELAPDALRKAGLINAIKDMNWSYNDKGNLHSGDLILKSYDSNMYKYPNKFRNSNIIGTYNYEVYKTVKDSADKRNFVLNIGGDHSIASGTISALKASYPLLKIIWVDAHADINSAETTQSDNYHGCPVSHLLGLTPRFTCPGFDWLEPNLNFHDIVYIGLRNIDLGEKRFLRDYNIKHFCMEEVTEKGIGQVMNETFDYFNKNKQTGEMNYPIHISFDIDGIDYKYIQQTGTVCRGGLTDLEANHIIRRVVSSTNLVSMDLVEFNPLLGTEAEKLERSSVYADFPYIKGSQTACLSLELIISALGYRVCL